MRIAQINDIVRLFMDHGSISSHKNNTNIQEKQPAGTIAVDDDTRSRILEALPHIDSFDRETWIRVGMALRNIGFSFEVWDEWSKTRPDGSTNSKYADGRDGSTADKWRSFAQTTSKWNAGTIIRMAKDAGWMSTVKKDAADAWHEPDLDIVLVKKGSGITQKVVQSIANFEEAICYDPQLFKKIAYNTLSNAICIIGPVPWRRSSTNDEWTDDDDSALRGYLERTYKLSGKDKCYDALINVAHKNEFHPVRRFLNRCHEEWDGGKHVDYLLSSLLGANESTYNNAVLHLFMKGAITRAFIPGSKFDYAPILKGPQGIGKSTFVRLLAGNDAWTIDNFKSFEKDGMEALRGIFIAELGELSAFNRAKDIETIKAFISSVADTYRPSYGRRATRFLRQCVFIGTTNADEFLADRTGNRRFLPINVDGHEPTINMFTQEDAARAEIRQAWGEVMDEFARNGGRWSLVLPEEFAQEAYAAQTQCELEEPWTGQVQKYLDDQTGIDRVCSKLLWEAALGNQYTEPTRADLCRISNIMHTSVTGWHAAGSKTVGKYGQQRCFERDDNSDQSIDALEIPF